LAICYLMRGRFQAAFDVFEQFHDRKVPCATRGSIRSDVN
jgi:pentatricopeptide repeat protein